MSPWRRLLAAIGGRRIVGGLGGLFVVVALGRASARLDAGAPLGNVLIVTVLIAGPGLVLLYGGSWLARSDVDPEFYPDVAGWSLGGFAVMAGLLALFHLQPEGGISEPATGPPILTALSSVAGFAIGVHDGAAKTRARALEERNRELHRTQEELEETVARLADSERRYRTLTENFPNGTVALLDTDLRYTLVGGQGFEEFDLEPGDLRGERIHDVFVEEYLEVFEPNYRATLAGEPTSFEVAVQGRTLEFRTHPLTDDDGEVYAILSMMQDVTARERSERELRRRARQQQVVAELGQFALETDDPDELMHEAARRVADTLDANHCKVLELDADAEELLLRQGVGWDEGIVGEATVSSVEAASQASYTLANDHPVVVEDLETEPRFDGPALLTDHGVRSGVSTTIGPFDEAWGVLGVHDTEPRTFSDEDVTFVQSVANVLAEAIERHRYEDELEGLVADLEESNRRLEQFAYAASHDLQEPLRMVSSYLQLLERRYGDDLDPEGLEFLAFAVDGADRMRSMIDGLLEYSRVETQGGPFETVDLEAVLEDVRTDLQVRIVEHDAEITVGSLPRVLGDPDQLRQVFQNLVDNAITYSGDEPPVVEVSARRDGDEWIVSVADQGVGIDPGDQDRIFEVFQRAHRRDEGDGTGIGLAVCERIVERHDGDIWVDSSPGGGTTISVALPAASARVGRAGRDGGDGRPGREGGDGRPGREGGNGRAGRDGRDGRVGGG